MSAYPQKRTLELSRVMSALCQQQTSPSVRYAPSAACYLMEVRYDLPDFRRCMLPAKSRSGNQIFAHRQSANDDGVESNLTDEVRSDINSVRVVAGDRNSDEFALPVRVRRQLGGADRVESAHNMRARQEFRRR